MNKEISNKIKYLYLILTIGMVMYHANWYSANSVKYINGIDHSILNFYSGFANHIGTLCMSFFFFMSAFWFYKDINTKEDLINKWKKRIRTLIIPFLCWTLILFIYKLLFAGLEFRIEDTFFHLFEKPVAGPLWYLLALLLLQLLSPIILIIKKHKKTTILFLSFISLYLILRRFGIIPTFLVFDRWWWYENVLTYTPVYLLGCYIGMYHKNIIIEEEYNSKLYTIIGVILLFVSFILWSFFINVDGIITCLYSVIELVGIWFVLKPSLFANPIPEKLDCTFYIYALHNPVLIPNTHKGINFITKHFNISGFEMVFIKLIQIISIIIICCIIKYLIVKLLPKKVDSYLTGGR